MTQIRTYIKTSGRTARPSMRRIDSERVRLDWHGLDGALLASAVMSNAEASALGPDVTIFMSPEPAPPPPPPPGQYQFNNLVFEDNFDTLDPTRWLLYDGVGHAGNGIRDPNAWSIQGGVEGATGKALVCTAMWDAAVQKIRSGGMMMKNQSHTSGGFEARVRFEADPLHVTNALFMTWPDGPGDGGWPENGENNIWESNSGDRAPMMTFIHFDPDNKQKAYAHPGSDGTQWNVVRMEWTAEAIKIFVNGELSWTMDDKAAIPTHPHHVTLQQDAMRNADPQRPVRAYYDYVRIYK